MICKAPSCRQKFQPARPMQQVCSVECAREYSLAKKLRDERKAKREEAKKTRERKAAIKTTRELVKEAQIAFNEYIRTRDQDRPCICCGASLTQESIGGGFDCGHYRSVGSAPHLRFDERNAHGQTKRCNRYGSGRAVDYRIGLVARIGLAAVEALEADNTPRHYTREELIELRRYYKAKTKALKEAK